MVHVRVVINVVRKFSEFSGLRPKSYLFYSLVGTGNNNINPH
jgi:hypothetical protein